MKKIMIAAAIVCAAALANAASVKWTCTNVYAGNTSDKVSGVAYLMLSSDVADFSALKGKGASAINDALAKALTSYTPSSAGAYGLTMTNAELGLADDHSYGSAYLVIFDTATVTDTSKFYVTAAKNLETVSGDFTASLGFASQYAGSSVAGNWSSVAAPEPTSGMLLLLGMAGLALKRKRV